MSQSFDQHAINHATVAVRLEMTPRGGKREADCDTLFFGGPPPTEIDQDRLGQFGLSKNYHVVFASFDPADPAAGPVGFHAVITDGETKAMVLQGGRLWKADRRSPAVLLFAGAGILLKLSAKGRLVTRPIGGEHHQQGFELAREAVAARAAGEPGGVSVVSNIGDLVTVLDGRALMTAFDAA